MCVGALEQLEFLLQFRSPHLFKIFFETLETFFDLAKVADHQVEFDILDVSQRIYFRDERDRRVFKHAHDMGQRVHLSQVADVGGFLERVLTDCAHVDIFDRRVGQLLRVVECSQTVKPVVRNFSDPDVRFARVAGLGGEMRLGQNAEQ